MRKDVLHCVCVDELSNYSVDRMIDYKHHMRKDVLHCVCVDELSNYSVD
jgi:hypothetical protein